MKTILLVAATMLPLSAGVANAESEGDPNVTSQARSAVAMTQHAPTVRVFATQSGNGTWLFAPQDGGGANN